MKKWCSNSPTILRTIPSIDRLSGDIKEIMDLDTKALGVAISVSKDLLIFVNLDQFVDTKLTKRSVASFTAKLGYDPLGQAAPFVLQARCILRDVHAEKIGWDDPIPEQLKKRWQSWLEKVPYLTEVTYPRWTLPQSHDLEIHIFSDASENAYGSVAYLRRSIPNIDVEMVLSRSRVAPLKIMTIPQLELEAALLGTKLLGKVLEVYEIPKSRVYLWSDSMIVLWWLCCQPSTLKPFQGNRVRKIQDAGGQWGYVNTHENPGDLASRGCDPGTLNTNLWRKGASWLSLPKAQWPKPIEIVAPIPEKQMLRKHYLAHSFKCHSIVPMEELLERHNSLDKILRITAYVFRWKRNSALRGLPVGAMETKFCLVFWVGLVQKQVYRKIFEAIENQEAHDLSNLSPIIHDDKLVVGGRL